MGRVLVMYRGDLQPPLRGVAYGDDEQPQSFEGAQAITVRLVDADGVRVVDDQPITIEGVPKGGAWRRDWIAGETDRLGVLDGELHVTLADGDPMTFGGFQVVFQKRKGEP